MPNLKFWEHKKVADNMQASQHRDCESKKMLGMFEVVRELGKGTMGLVYLGKDHVSNRDVAIKTMTLESEFNAVAPGDAKLLFLREARILTWLNHPDIVTIYDVGEDNGLVYIAMEFLKGVVLTKHTRPYSLLPLPVVLGIIARAADALNYAHEQNVIHRDVKPGNIMYEHASNTVKVMDFGISMLTTLADIQNNLVLGSPLYMSPEQVMGKQINALSDLFSLGTSLYQLLSGHLPFKGDSASEVMQRIAKEPHPNILSVKTDLPSCVATIVDQALAKDKKNRYQCGGEMAEAIRQCAALL